ncbi:MAG: Hsp20/alpha crystallin family protein [Methanocorpusculum sp.]|uniref:Hsp20/alpha crystallin family protein n=1 Tax=Methanocorpusculum sp. TaxID=2058474 RepID=UPI002725274C|nr:Hsp20/alpha crystallin family protein [Methanocorpusculum sp.]MDO9522092.1 Hsp20/alpha crystallin family protein [Methanocorpusculum sp.]
MSIRSYPFSFGTIGSELDTFFSEMEERAESFASHSDSIKTMAKNAIPRITGDFYVDLCETPSEIIITCDLPGIEKEDVSVKLLNETTLQIKTKYDRDVSNTDASGIYHLRERRSGAGERIIRLPVEVIAEGAKASFKNGIMEITLPKSVKDPGVPIEIE